MARFSFSTPALLLRDGGKGGSIAFWEMCDPPAPTPSLPPSSPLLTVLDLHLVLSNKVLQGVCVTLGGCSDSSKVHKQNAEVQN